MVIFYPEVWGRHYWYVIHSIAMTYPDYPNDVMKKKYYDFFYNLPIFLPNSEIGNYFATLLEHYPLTPYLDNRNSLLQWTHYIHNKINIKLSKPTISFRQFMDEFAKYNRPLPIQKASFMKSNNQLVSFMVVCFLVGFIVYNK